MTQVIDRRGQSGNSDVSRKRFLERNKGSIKRAVDRAIGSGNITDMGKGGIDVSVPKEDISEPFIHHRSGGGVNDYVRPGNKEFSTGDRLPKPRGGQGGRGNQAGDDGDGEDDFTFHLTEEEFLNYLFNDLELPNLEDRTEADMENTKLKYAGIVTDGPHNKLDLARSKRQKMGRMVASSAGYNEKILKLLEEEKSILQSYNENAQPVAASGLPKAWIPRKDRIRKLERDILDLKKTFGASVLPIDQQRIANIESNVMGLRKRVRAIPGWNESTDLKFRFHAPQPQPNSKAVMFCVMDVSGSMDEERKANAKIFYFLLHRFLKKHYTKVDVVFIRHTTQALEVNEKDFFYNRETGGTIVSPALELMSNIQKERYSDGEWNIYGAQASDGDNWGQDSAKCREMMRDILPRFQGYFYTEIREDGHHQNLWDEYQGLKAEFPNKFWMGGIRERKDIFPVFREFFQKRSGENQPVRASAYALG